MLITCPQCSAKFNLPENQITDNNARLRCSFCNTVFSIQEGIQDSMAFDADDSFLDEIQENNSEPLLSESPTTTPDTDKKNSLDDAPIPVVPKKKGSSLFMIIFLLLFIIAGGWIFNIQYKKHSKIEEVLEDPSHIMQQQIKELSIKDYRQYFITNNPNVKKPLFIVEGKIQNNSKEAKAFIVVKASLFNDKGEMIVEQEMLSGVALSLFQLQTMKEDDIDAMLKDPLEIAITNSNVLPQQEVPFMIIFFDPPREIAEFSVQIISATKADDFGSK